MGPEPGHGGTDFGAAASVGPEEAVREEAFERLNERPPALGHPQLVSTVAGKTGVPVRRSNHLADPRITTSTWDVRDRG